MRDKQQLLSGSGRFYLILLTIALLALVVRMWGITFGLPFLYRGDEAVIVDRALRMPLDGPNPHWFSYPTLYIYFQCFVYLLVYGFGWLFGVYSNYSEFARAAVEDPTIVYQTGRGVTAILGAAAVALTGIAGSKLSSLGEWKAEWIGLGAALLLCLNYIHAEHSHYISTDVPVSFVAACLLLQMGSVALRSDGGTVRQYVVAGLLVGVAASLKYPGALLSSLILYVYVQRLGLRDWKTMIRDYRLPAAAAASLFGFVAGSPFVVLAFREFARDFSAEAEHMRTGHLGFEAVQNGWIAYSKDLYETGGLALLAFFLIGGLQLVFRRDVFGRALVALVLTLFGIAGLSNALFTRYLIPLMPAACLVAAYSLVAVATAVPARLGKLTVPLAIVLLVVTTALPAYLIVHRLRLFSAPDTRTLAWGWVAESFGGLGDPRRISIERHSIPLAQRQIDHVTATPLVYDLARLEEQGVRFVAVSDRMYRRFLRVPDRYPVEAAFYRTLLTRGMLVEVFSPFDDETGRLALKKDGSPSVTSSARGALWDTLPTRELAGPVIEIYELPAVGAKHSSHSSQADDQETMGEGEEEP
jgi:hypothetical protein